MTLDQKLFSGASISHYHPEPPPCHPEPVEGSPGARAGHNAETGSAGAADRHRVGPYEHLSGIRRLLVFLITFAMLGTSLAGFSGQVSHAQEGESLRVATTFSIAADWAENVGGDNVEVTSIVPAGGDAHTFDPTPAQVGEIAEADIIIEIGAQFEPWLDGLVDASETDAPRVVLSEGMDLIAYDDVESDAHDHDHDHDHGDLDPHVWQDVDNAIIATNMIAEAFVDADPDNADAYMERADDYVAQLEELNTFIEDEVATLSEEQRKLVTSHDTFQYFARAYDFEVVGTAFSAATTEGGDPSAQEVAELVEMIQEENVPAVFAENVANPDLIQMLADEAGVTVAPTLYTDALGEDGSDGDTYIGMMEFNVTTIVDALSEDGA